MRRRSAGEQTARPASVEFVTEEPPPESPAVGAGRGYRATVFAVVGVALLLGLLDVVFHGQSDDGRPAPAVASTASGASSPVLTRPVPARQCPGSDCPNSDVPEADVIAAFTADVPGAILSSEHTVLSTSRAGRQVLAQRVLRMAFGNVDMTVTITRSGGREPAPPAHARVRRLIHGGYVFVVSTVGLYPPTDRQLRVLAADPRVLAIHA